MSAPRRPNLLALVGPGLLVAATGVGAGDLATGAFTGRQLGTAVLWAVLVGAGVKYVLSEGLTRWQLVTGETLLEGACKHLGAPVRYGFLVYLLLWSFGVGAALMSACGVAAHALVPIWDGPTDKQFYGVVHSLVAMALVVLGGYRLFEKVMSVCIAIMFATVVSVAILIGPAWGEILPGLCVPTIPHAEGKGLEWTIALLGGVGGTLTIVCYGYWIREENRTSIDNLRTCRMDLASGYGMTALFGIGMVIIGAVSKPESTAKGAELIVDIGAHLGASPALGGLAGLAEWAFLIGAWCAVFSSLFGVWQCTPYLFADFWNLSFRKEGDERLDVVDTTSRAYRGYLLALGTVPIVLLLLMDFRMLQKWNAIWGALVIPLLAVALLILNGRSRWIGEQYRNSKWTTCVLVLAVLFFTVSLALVVRNKLFV